MPWYRRLDRSVDLVPALIILACCGVVAFTWGAAPWRWGYVGALVALGFGSALAREALAVIGRRPVPGWVHALTGLAVGAGFALLSTRYYGPRLVLTSKVHIAAVALMGLLVGQWLLQRLAGNRTTDRSNSPG